MTLTPSGDAVCVTVYDRVEFVSIDGTRLPSPLPAHPDPKARPMAADINRAVDLVMVYRRVIEESEFIEYSLSVVCYRLDEGRNSWRPATSHAIDGAWRDWARISWISHTDVILAVQDKDKDYWLIRIDINTGVTTWKERTRYEYIRDICVSKHGKLYVCHRNIITEYDFISGSQTHEFSLDFPRRNLCHPDSLCTDSEGRLLVIQREGEYLSWTHSVTMWSREGDSLVFVKDVIFGLPDTRHPKIRLHEDKSLVVTQKEKLSLYKI